MKKVLFVTYGGGHVNMVLPVVQALMKGRSLLVEVLALTTARSVLEAAGVSCISFRDLEIDKEANAYGVALTKDQLGHSLVPFEESVAYMGLSYQCLINEHGEAEAMRLYEQGGRQSFLPVAAMEKLIKGKGYDLVVATNSPRAERAAIVAAGNLNIPSVCIVDLFATQGVKWLGKPKYANKVCVLTESVKNLLCEAGRKSEEIVVTGNPAFDRLADAKICERGKELRHTKGWDDKKVVLWCSQPEPSKHPFTQEAGNPELPFKIEKELKRICDLHVDKGWHLFVRPHPSENLEQRACLANVEYGREDYLPSLLKAVDVVVVTSSTVGLEAALLEKQVVALSMSVFSADMPFAAMGLAMGVDSLDELENGMTKALSSEKKLMNSQMPKLGKATESICAVIESLLRVKE